MSVNWWGNRPKYFISLLKSWYGEHATKENDFCYGYVPKLDAGVDYSHLYIFDRMRRKCSVRGKMSSGLSRSGGINTGKTLMR